MSLRRLAPEQPTSFAFTPENKAWAEKQIKKYPEGRQASAIVPLLWRAQEQNGGHVTEPMIRVIGEMLGLSPIRVLEIATFYTMFHRAPVGKYHLQCCTTTPCWLRGSAEVVDAMMKHLGIGYGEVTKDGLFSMIEVECLGGCVNAPIVQINDDFYEDLDAASIVKILNALKAGEQPKPGPQIGRQASAPVGGPTTLKSTGVAKG